jgi:AraC-like DNA-binding protein
MSMARESRLHAMSQAAAAGAARRLFVRLDGDPLYAPETGVPRGTLREFAVDAALQGHVANVMVYRERFGAGQAATEHVLPDGALRLIVHLGATPSAVAVGASATPTVLRLTGELHGLSVTLRRGAATALLGVPAGELAGRAFALHELWGAGAATLAGRIAEAADDAGRAALLQHVLAERVRAARRPPDALVAHALQRVAESAGAVPLRALAAALGIGERRLQQRFREQAGLSPRAWARVCRLHACVRALRGRPQPRWAELALDAGFCDQAHLVNEFRALCGLSPGGFLKTVKAATTSRSSNPA